MERKTIGGFIAALRRANGMTQRELAERLNVSDKTVSRWERDESAPDLAAIPVLAEIFGVSCDELLRGERRPPEERGGPEAVTQRGEKERRRLIALSLSRFRARTYIIMGVAAAGLLAAMVCDLALLRAYIGFFAGAAFYLAAAVAEAALLSRRGRGAAVPARVRPAQKLRARPRRRCSVAAVLWSSTTTITSSYIWRRRRAAPGRPWRSRTRTASSSAPTPI